MGEIKPQPVRRNERAFLQHVLAQHSSQRRMQQVCPRVITHRRASALRIHGGLDLGADRQACR